MSQVITATFEDGVLKPSQPLNIPVHSRVRLILEIVDEDEQAKKNQETLSALEDLWRHSKVHSTEERLTRDQLHERR